MSETEGFDRVLVIDGGRIVEDGPPVELLSQESSRYRALVDSERELSSLWSDGSWRKWEIRDGAIHEREHEAL